MADKFRGFPPDLFSFLADLKKNNRRDWFQANKDRYTQSVVEPMSEFISVMDGRLANVSDCFIADPRPHGGSMFRIYRDTRFSKDKKPYKEHVACQFRHMSGKDAHAPGFYMHFDVDEVFFGGGIWMPPGPTLRLIRDAIAADPDGWVKATRNKGFKARFGSVAGDALKRPPQGFDADDPLIEDIKRKSFFAMQEVAPKAALAPGFAAEVEKAFVALTPMMRFLTEALDLSFELDA
jgi:uncharacterized protein (TIGR02453 family)